MVGRIPYISVVIILERNNYWLPEICPDFYNIEYGNCCFSSYVVYQQIPILSFTRYLYGESVPMSTSNVRRKVVV